MPVTDSIQGYQFDPAAAVAYLAAVDSGLARCIQSVGEFQLSVRRNRSVFEYLIRSIVYQQLSGRAAATIYGRLLDQFPYRRIRPLQLLARTAAELRAAGLSGSKCRALKDLAETALAGQLPETSQLHRMDDDEIVQRLTAIWGVGRWTVEMLLIFYLGRPDILPLSDLGVRKGYQRVRGYSILPPTEKLERAGKRWRPYRTVASWYLWRSLDVQMPS
jgi:3-methyladenine DNA glycosylase/8-oxoguanine DNA glycosylase